MEKLTYQEHHDGLGLNDLITIEADEPDHEKGGGARHHYKARIDVTHTAYAIDAGCAGFASQPCLDIQFQHGPRNDVRSEPGVTDAVLLAILLDRYRSFQAGPFATRENAIVITKLEEALMWMERRAKERARRGVLGTLEK